MTSSETTHLTFSVLASKALQGQSAWSDRQWSELDSGRPPLERRVVVTVQKAIGSEDDPPSAVLADRCRDLCAEPPPPVWTGTHVARSK